MNLLRNFWEWLVGQFWREVAEEDALCEFDCRKPQCHEGEWESCARRLQRAAGELMPAKEISAEGVDSTPANDAIQHDFDRV